MVKIDPLEVFALRAEGWTLARLAARYGCSIPAVSLFLTRPHSRFNETRASNPCACGCGRLAEPGRKYLTQACYYAHLEATAIGGPYVQWRQGQRIARQVVRASGFDLQPGHVVHHVDRDTRNNGVANLWVFACHADHTSFHRGGVRRPIWRGDGVREVAA